MHQVKGEKNVLNPKVRINGEIRIGIGRFSHFIKRRGEVWTDHASVLVRQFDTFARSSVDVGARENICIKPLTRICIFVLNVGLNKCDEKYKRKIASPFM